ncbi:hypothetical protein KMW28_02475 [Flammeovirga yaeyamensis]|uniref:Uncharacterized protein n=1 Tax=Flammeovirga yaeyamensis TaxID=367791 RepID=A0AAX1N4P7_9BACT|nr:hypothetical protein [Flammeovirga yaeyamensis]MBB3700378.1 hypothetical protein [Flammeovirga yaeyamensis]NMF36996.1 hypothetical protein [Flammeovirga yaeyamensis]QWG02460.1 hypothetical protein KMW28_02475 [Flammeovirga yaeyamensis]
MRKFGRQSNIKKQPIPKVYYVGFAFITIVFIYASVKKYFISKEINECGIITKAKVSNYRVRKTKVAYYYNYQDESLTNYSGKETRLKKIPNLEKGGHIYIVYPCSDPSKSTFLEIDNSFRLASDSLLVRAYAKEHNLRMLE